jgi:ABC-type glycerol-3-phosphate transport system substrate-binding protein
MKTKMLILALVLALIVAAAGAALANGGLARPREVLGGGASDSAAGDVTLRATLGQPVVGVVFGGDVTLSQGFWRGGPPGYKNYVPLVLRH